MDAAAQPLPTGDPGRPDFTKNSSACPLISTIDPVKGANNSFLNCGQNATVASNVASVNPGSSLTFQWEAGGGEDVSSTGSYFMCLLVS